MSDKSSLFFVFDVESRGLRGEGFAVGWVVVDATGEEYESGLLVTEWRDSSKRWATSDVDAWLTINIPPMEITHESADSMRLHFLKVLEQWGAKVYGLWVDWGYPVETNFLEQCWKASYLQHCGIDIPPPLHEIATLELAAGIIGETPRLPSELPEHNPLNDARHSARKLVRAMARLRQLSGSGFNVEQYNDPGVPTAPVFCHYGYGIVGQTKSWVSGCVIWDTPDLLEDELKRAREMEPEQNYQIVQLFCVKNWAGLDK